MGREAADIHTAKMTEIQSNPDYPTLQENESNMLFKTA
jgi:hypothetical protein